MAAVLRIGSVYGWPAVDENDFDLHFHQGPAIVAAGDVEHENGSKHSAPDCYRTTSTWTSNGWALGS
jgi:hypothetical protein